MRVSIRNVSVLVVLSVASAEADAIDFSYSGRLVEASGRPVSGPVALKLSFFLNSSSTSPVLELTKGLEDVQLQQGIFQVTIDFSPNDYNTAFPSVLQQTFVQVTDLTHAAKAPYAAQQISVVPYAAKVPLDSKVLSFDSQGKLSLALSSLPAANQFLTKDSLGQLVWGTPATAATMIQGQTINAAAPSAGQILTYDGTQWTPASPSASAVFTGVFAGDVAGPQTGTVVNTVGTSTAAQIHSAEVAANAASSANVSSALVKRDGSGNFSAGTITASLVGNATSASSFTGSLAGDVSGPQGTTVVATVGGVSAANVASGANLANAGVSANTVSTLVKRDNSGNFTAGTITASLTGNVTGNVSGSAASVTGVVGPANGGSGVANNALSTFTVSGAYPLTTNLSAATNVTLPTSGTLATLAGSETLTNKTFTAPVISSIANSGTLTLPFGPDTLVGRATTDTLSNKTLASPTVTGSLEVDGSIAEKAAGPAFYLYDTSGTVDNRQFIFWNSGGGVQGNWVNDADNTTVAHSISFKNDGKVGIGTTIPGAPLHVVASSGETLRLDAVNPSLNFYQHSGAWLSGEIQSLDMGAYATDLAFSTEPMNLGGPTPLVERLRLAASGNVGIGTSQPTAALEISSATSTTPRLLFTGAPVVAGGSTAAGAGVGLMLGYNATGNRQIWFQDSAATFNTADVALRIGFSPGSASIDGISTDGSTLKNVTFVGTFSSFSDRRLKTDIEPIDGALSRIAQLNGVRFRYRDEPDVTKRTLGLIAQEVEKVFPEAVSTTDQGFLRVNYPSLIGPVVQAVNEERLVVSSLEVKVDALATTCSEEVSRLKAENALLKTYLCGKDPAAAFCQP